MISRQLIKKEKRFNGSIWSNDLKMIKKIQMNSIPYVSFIMNVTVKGEIGRVQFSNQIF